MRPILETKHIKKSFDGLEVLRDVSFNLSRGTITTLFGENGSGKTTLFHIISGFMRADGGKILFSGHDMRGKSAVEMARMGIGRVWQSSRIFRNLSVMDNLLLASKNHPGERVLSYFLKPRTIWSEEKKRKKQATVIAEEVGIAHQFMNTAGSLSLGEQKLLSIGMLLMYEAELLLMDEPFTGVNGRMVDAISHVLLGLSKQGKTIFLVEHNVEKAIAISNFSLKLSEGKLIKEKILNG